MKVKSMFQHRKLIQKIYFNDILIVDKRSKNK